MTDGVQEREVCEGGRREQLDRGLGKEENGRYYERVRTSGSSSSKESFFHFKKFP